MPNIFILSDLDLVLIPILYNPNSILLILSDSLCLSSLIPEKLDTPFITEAITNNKGNSSIAKGTNFFEQFMGFSLLLVIRISPTGSPDSFFYFKILILAFIFFKILINPMRVGLQLTPLINNFDPLVNKAKRIKGAADEGSPGIFKLKL